MSKLDREKNNNTIKTTTVQLSELITHSECEFFNWNRGS